MAFCSFFRTDICNDWLLMVDFKSNIIKSVNDNGTIANVKIHKEDIVEKTVLHDEIIERLLYHKGETAYVSPR